MGASHVLPIGPYMGPQALPLLGAFFTGPELSDVHEFESLCFLVSYVSAAIGGEARFRAEWADNDVDFFLDLRRDVLTPNQLVPDEIDGIAATAAPQTVNYVLLLRNPGGLSRVRLLVAESGTLLTPGTVTIQRAASQF